MCTKDRQYGQSAVMYNANESNRNIRANIGVRVLCGVCAVSAMIIDLYSTILCEFEFRFIIVARHLHGLLLRSSQYKTKQCYSPRLKIYHAPCTSDSTNYRNKGPLCTAETFAVSFDRI